MIRAALTGTFIACLFHGRMPQTLLISLCVGLTLILSHSGRHKHTPFVSIDVLAQTSRLKEVNATLKFWTVMALMIISVASQNSVTGVFLSIVAFILVVCVGGLRRQDYVQIIALPLSFLMIGGLALLFEVTSAPMGVINLNVFGRWLCVSAQAQARTTLVVARAFGALSCLTLLSVTTPMSAIISVLRRARCPELVIDLMYLIYRYIFILLSLHHEMRDAATSRLGFRDYRTSIRTTGSIYANLLARSYQFAGKNFDAMESRCYDAGIRFLESSGKISGMQITAAIAITIAALGVSWVTL